MYTTVVHVALSVSRMCNDSISKYAADKVSWAYDLNGGVPTVFDVEDRGLVNDNLRFWKRIDTQVQNNGPFYSLKIFKHGAQSFFSKTKGGVDSATQYPAMLPFSACSLRWEQKLVLQTLKTMTVNKYVAHHMYLWKELRKSEESFGSIDRYRHLLNNVASFEDFLFGDFLFDICAWLLQHASMVAKTEVAITFSSSSIKLKSADDS